jgi:hypothetical protein
MDQLSFPFFFLIAYLKLCAAAALHAFNACIACGLFFRKEDSKSYYQGRSLRRYLERHDNNNNNNNAPNNYDFLSKREGTMQNMPLPPTPRLGDAQHNPYYGGHGLLKGQGGLCCDSWWWRAPPFGWKDNVARGLAATYRLATHH